MFSVSFTVWLIIGFLFLAAELVSGTFFLMFFGVSGLLVALAKLTGLNNFFLESAVFAIFGFLGVLVLRKPLLAKRSKEDVVMDKDQFLTLSVTLDPGGSGTSSYQGSPWTVVNDSNEKLDAGTEVKIVKTEGIKLFVVRK
ncbi:MAG: NfeD family protein [Pseudobdellovibrionaceae bacterium]